MNAEGRMQKAELGTRPHSAFCLLHSAFRPAKAAAQNPPLMYFHCTIFSLISRRRREIMRQRRLRNCSDAFGSIERISFSVARSIESTVASPSCAFASAERGL